MPATKLVDGFFNDDEAEADQGCCGVLNGVFSHGW